jgi:hypothetical protein
MSEDNHKIVYSFAGSAERLMKALSWGVCSSVPRILGIHVA